MKYLLYQLEYRQWLLFAVALAILIHLLPAPAGLPDEGKSVLAITVMTIVLVMSEPVPLPVIGLLILVLEVLFNVSSTRAVAQSFMSDSVIFIAGSLMLAVAVVKQQLDKRILLLVLRVTRDSIQWTLFVLVAISALLASVMGEHAVAAIMLPVSLILTRILTETDEGSGPLHSVFLMAVAYGCAVAAIGTPSGGARNAIMLSYLDNLAGLQMGYLEWTLFMYPLVLLQIPLLYGILRYLYPTDKVTSLSGVYSELASDIGQTRLKVEDWITISIMIFTLLMWIFFSRSLGLGPIAVLGVLLCISTGVLNWEDINRDLNWGIVLLYASIISLGLWMDQTGAAGWLAGGMQAILGAFGITGGFPLVVSVSIVGMVVGSILSTGPAIAILGPIVLQQADIAAFDPLVLSMVMVASTSYANFTPMSSPACTIVYGSERVQRQSFLRIGLLLAVASLVMIFVAAEVYWPFVESFFE